MSSVATGGVSSAGSRRASSASGRASASVSAAGTNSFIGRDEQVLELVGLLENERLVTLSGAPGIGKSRLGVELARQLARRDRAARQVVELAAVTRAGDVPRSVAAALSVQEVAGESLVDVLVARLSRRRSLLVLDNCEHLLEGCRELIEALLSGCPKLRVVATSREPLGLDSERVWQVPPLTVPAAGEPALPERLVDYAAVGLFVERAAAAQPGFALNAFVAPAVVEICRRLDGIPLAIELAAARVESLTPQEIARRLEDRFTLLVGGGEDALARHQTLQAALDWSHELLSGAERALLSRLSVFSGSFELEAAAEVCSGGEIEPGDVAELLERLVAKSLVVFDSGEAPTPRFGLLETVRVYAGERLAETGELAERRLAHARFFLALAGRAEPELTGAHQIEWLARLEPDRANLRAALEWSLSHGQAELALRLAGALVLFWRVRCHFSEGRELLETALRSSGAVAVELRAKALWGIGFMALMAGDRDDAIPLLEESLADFRELGDHQGCARALLVLGNCWAYRGGDPQALALLEDSAAEAREADDPWCLSHALAIAGFEHYSGGDLIAARPLFEQCLQVAREVEDKQGLRFGLQGLGLVAKDQGDFELAESVFGEAVGVTAELGDHYCRAMTLEYLGDLAAKQGDFARAGMLWDDALELIREVGARTERPGLLVRSARIAHLEGERGRTRRLFEECLTLSPGASRERVSCLQGMARLAADEGDRGAAYRLWEESLELARASGNELSIAMALHGLGQLAREEGEVKRAAVLHNEALGLWRQVGSAGGIAISLEAIAGLAAGAGRYEHAARLFGAVSALRDQDRLVRSPGAASQYEADIALVRDRLSREEYESAFAEGAALSIDEAVAQASRRAQLGSSADGWSSLTDTEREVAELAAQGLSNPEIAECQFVTRATVKTHLSHIYAKLGMSGRSELTREVLLGGAKTGRTKE